MNKIVLLLLSLVLIFQGCATVKKDGSDAGASRFYNMTYEMKKPGYDFDRLFDAVMLVLHKEGYTIIEKDRVNGSIKTPGISILLTRSGRGVLLSIIENLDSEKTVSYGDRVYGDILKWYDNISNGVQDKEFIDKNNFRSEKELEGIISFDETAESKRIIITNNNKYDWENVVIQIKFAGNNEKFKSVVKVIEDSGKAVIAYEDKSELWLKQSTAVNGKPESVSISCDTIHGKQARVWKW